jgi:hypothetical protein
MSKISEININSLSKAEQDDLLKLAEQINHNRLLTKQYESFKASSNISIRWDASHREFGFSFAGVTVTPEEVEHIVREKLKQ